MKKSFISVGLFFGLSSLVASATDYVSTNVATNEANGNYYGFAANLKSSVIASTVPEFGDLEKFYLKNVALDVRTTSSQGVGVNLKLAVYSYTADKTTGTLLGLSSNSQTSTLSQKMSFDFDSILLGPVNTTYQFLFVDSSVTDLSEIDTFDEYKSKSKLVGLKVVNGASGMLPQGSGTYKSNLLNSWEGQYMPKFTITTTDVAPSIPEPSLFGLLAGMGALTLVASRRRHK